MEVGNTFTPLLKRRSFKKNKVKREIYNSDYIYNPLFSFFNYIIYINKAYINPTL
jgi:hypothetical protein